MVNRDPAPAVVVESNRLELSVIGSIAHTAIDARDGPRGRTDVPIKINLDKPRSLNLTTPRPLTFGQLSKDESGATVSLWFWTSSRLWTGFASPVADRRENNERRFSRYDPCDP